MASLLLAIGPTILLAAPRLAVKAGHIIPVGIDPIDYGTIVIEGPRIASIGGDVVIPPGTRVLDVGDKYVTPGLIDAQSRLFVMDGERGGGATPELDILDGLDPFVEEDVEVLAEGVTAVHVYPNGGSLFGGRSAVLKLKKSRSVDGLVLKRHAAVRAAIGVSGNGTSSSLERLGDYASLRETLRKTQLYRKRKQRHDRAMIEYKRKRAEYDKKAQAKQGEKPKWPGTFGPDPTYEVLTDVLDGKIPLQIEAHRVPDILNAIRLAEEFGFSLILDRCTEGYLVAEQIARAGVPVIVGPATTSFVDMPRLEYRRHNPANGAILAEHRIRVALGVCGRDGAVSRFVAITAAMAVGNGMSEDMALRAVTLSAAEILGVADRIGSLEPGKDADLVVFSGHPLSAQSRVEIVMIEGKVVFERKDAK